MFSLVKNNCVFVTKARPFYIWRGPLPQGPLCCTSMFLQLTCRINKLNSGSREGLSHLAKFSETCRGGAVVGWLQTATSSLHETKSFRLEL